MRVVTISWPADPDRGTETYGKPDWTDADRRAWVDEIEPLVPGAHYLLHLVREPFDPAVLRSRVESNV